MQLELATWQEVEAYLNSPAGASRGILVPIGSTEQHGPNGLIGTDALCAQCIAVGTAEAIGCYVAPTISYGMSQHHLGFTGTATLRPSTLMLVVQDVVRSLHVHGFERFFFVNGHGGNVHTVNTAFDEIYAAASMTHDPDAQKIRCKTVMWQAGGRTRALAREFYGDHSGNHATAAEISLAQWYRPEAIKHAQMSPKVAPGKSDFYQSTDYRRRYADGRIGSDPSMSCPEHGAKLYEAAVTDMVETYNAFLAY